MISQRTESMSLRLWVAVFGFTAICATALTQTTHFEDVHEFAPFVDNFQLTGPSVCPEYAYPILVPPSQRYAMF